jgi:hypothetical protein
LFAHLKRILHLARLRLRGPSGAQDEFTLAAIARNLRRLAKLVARPPPAVAAVSVDAGRCMVAGNCGAVFLSAFGADLRLRTRRIFCQPCLDWSERRYHLKGLVGDSDSRSSIGAWIAQMCVGQPCTPINVVWKGGLVQNLPIEINKGCANRSIMRPTTADSLG